MKKIHVLGFMVCMLLFLFFFSPFSQAQFQVNHSQPIQGDLLIIWVPEPDVPPQGTFGGNTLTFRPLGEDWVAFFGISYWMEPGEYLLFLHGLGEESIQVQSGNFPESRIFVDPKQEELVDPEPEDPQIRERREADREKINQAYSKSHEEILWQGPFIWPAQGRITTGFGDTRYVNHRLTGRHSGIDIAAPENTPIQAANTGYVRLSEELLVTGETIILDHGWGIYSSYSHLNARKVQVGERVEKGQVIGLMGSTGFSTGSHLHWVIRTREAFLNPAQFLDTDIREMVTPSTETEKKILYLVQVGPFSQESAAQAVLAELTDLGFSGFTVPGETIRIQLGAFHGWENAQNLVQQLQEAGYAPFIREER